MTSKRLDQHAIRGSHYGFSAARLGDLGASEYTLVAVAADVSGSVSGFERDIERCLSEIVRACRSSPRADNLMLRAVAFDDKLEELHGFVPLAQIDPQSYDGWLRIGNTTALCDAAHNAVASVANYGRQLANGGFGTNAIVFVITDGGDNASSETAASVAKAVSDSLKDEKLESLATVLVGVNVKDAAVSGCLSAFAKNAGFRQYVELEHADAATLAKLAAFVYRSIAAQSIALGSGGLSRSLTF